MTAKTLKQALEIVMSYDEDAKISFHGGRLWVDEPDGLSDEDRSVLEGLGFVSDVEGMSSSFWTA